MDYDYNMGCVTCKLMFGPCSFIVNIGLSLNRTWGHMVHKKWGKVGKVGKDVFSQREY